MKYRWRRGPPPHIGWWNASVARDHKSWRWWNGAKWSNSAYNGEPLEDVLLFALTEMGDQERVEWNYSYPANARVPRRAP